MAEPACCNIINMTPISMKLRTTPSVYAMPYCLACAFSFSFIFTRLSAFIDRTGKTQGIKFKMIPPNIANPMAVNHVKSDLFCVVGGMVFFTCVMVGMEGEFGSVY